MYLLHLNGARSTEFNLSSIYFSNIYSGEEPINVYIQGESSLNSISFIFLFGFNNYSGSPELLMKSWKQYTDSESYYKSDIFSYGLLIFRIFT